jgi:hypothetical protein
MKPVVLLIDILFYFLQTLKHPYITSKLTHLCCRLDRLIIDNIFVKCKMVQLTMFCSNLPHCFLGPDIIKYFQGDLR